MKRLKVTMYNDDQYDGLSLETHSELSRMGFYDIDEEIVEEDDPTDNVQRQKKKGNPR